MDFGNELKLMSQFFNSGVTQSYKYRKQQLQKLKQVVEKYETEIYEALHKDLKKSPEECWVTENGMVLAEIKYAIKNLKRWMKPEKVRTNLLNFPSSSYIMKEPLGVVLIISPWNYPFQLLLKPLVGAIAAGNCIVLKSSEFAPATSRLMKQMIAETFDQRYILFTEGVGAEVVPQMMQQFTFDHIFFTGSTTVGKLIYQLAAQHLTPVTLELGGKSPCVVEKDADIIVAAKRIALTKFSNVGQMCVAPDYLLVHHSKREAIIEALKNTIDKFYSNNQQELAHYGKIINEKQFDRVVNYLKDGTVVHGGNHDKSALYIAPTLMTAVDLEAPIMKEEIFGPILPIIPFQTKEEAMDIISKNKNPLAFYVFTSSLEKANDWLQSVPAGGGCINNTVWHLTNHYLPFGGRGNSGIGQYQGRSTFDTFTHRRSILKTPTWFDPAIKYPPFGGKLNLFKKIIR